MVTLLLSLDALVSSAVMSSPSWVCVFWCGGPSMRLLADIFVFCSIHFSAKQGTQVVVAYRDPDEARHLKVCGDLGQVIPLVRRHPPTHVFHPSTYTTHHLYRNST